MATARLYSLILFVDNNVGRRVAEMLVDTRHTYREALVDLTTVDAHPVAARARLFFESVYPGCTIGYQMRVG